MLWFPNLFERVNGVIAMVILFIWSRRTPVHFKTMHHCVADYTMPNVCTNNTVVPYVIVRPHHSMHQVSHSPPHTPTLLVYIHVHEQVVLLVGTT